MNEFGPRKRPISAAKNIEISVIQNTPFERGVLLLWRVPESNWLPQVMSLMRYRSSNPLTVETHYILYTNIMQVWPQKTYMWKSPFAEIGHRPVKI